MKLRAMSFNKYLFQFTKDTDAFQTHLSFNKGKYNVPDVHYDKFYESYFKALKAGEKMYIIEKVVNSKFAFFLDLEAPKAHQIPLDTSTVNEVIQTTNDVIAKATTGETFIEYIVSRRLDKYHVNYPGVIVDTHMATQLVKEIQIKLQDKSVYIDASVYRTGLRLFGSYKKKVDQEEQSVYTVYDLDTDTYTSELDFSTFKKMIVRRKFDTKLTEMSLPESTSTMATADVSTSTGSRATTGSKRVTDVKLLCEIKSVLEGVQSTHTYFVNMDLTVTAVSATRNKFGTYCYYIAIKESVCPFKNRTHSRESNPVYIELSNRGVSMKCYDQECLRRRFPDSGVSLPDNFSQLYPRLASTLDRQIGTFKMTDAIQQYLEESLSGSHYKVARAAFEIYKDRFRVDDIKNTEFYEFDGVRWKRSYRMNILLSDDLPKYYQAIKVNTDTEGTEGTAVKNQVIDNLVNKLENVNFKANVIGQLTYLLKNYDPDFYKNLDQNPYLLGFKDGVYDFRTHTFRQGSPLDYITFSTGYDYYEYDTNTPEVKEIYEFLEKIIPKKRVLEYTLQVLGKSLVGIPDERFYMWTGLSGANGKSTLINFLENTLGDYISTVDVSLLTNKRTGSSNATPDIVRLRGRRLFTFQEPEHNDKLRTGILKQFTGGDTIVARELFKAPVSFKLQGTMVMCCNDLPSVTSIDGGTWRRIRVIEFTSRFCDNPVKRNEFKIDPTIKTKIKSWRPFFMGILINSLKQPFSVEPEDVTRATAKYKVDNDKFNEFFDESVEVSDTFESNKAIYNYFTGWWSSNYPMSKIPDVKELRRAMKIKYGEEKETKVNGVRNYGFNIKLCDKIDEEVCAQY